MSVLVDFVCVHMVALSVVCDRWFICLRVCVFESSPGYVFVCTCCLVLWDVAVALFILLLHLCDRLCLCF